MPMRKPVAKLQKLCVDYVANNIDALCSEHAKLKRVDQRLFNSIPFRPPGNVVCLNHLLNHHELFLVRIPFWPNVELDITHLLSRVGEQGDRLVELRVFAFLTEALLPDVVSALSKLPRLQRLTLKMVCIGETVISTITQHCTQLTEVSLSGSCLLEDCLDMFAVCTNIEVLVVNCYILNPDATAARSLQVLRLPRLRIFRCDILTQAIKLLDLSTRLSLTEYAEMNQRNLQPHNALAQVLHVCPLLTTVQLHLFGGEDLEAMRGLTHIQELSLYLWPVGSGIAFMMDFQPVLRAIGGKLKILRLWLANLDFTSFTTHCTALEELEICHIDWIRNYNGQQLAPLSRLETFRLSLNISPRVTPSIPGHIIAAFVPNLKRIDLEKCHLSDAQFEGLLNSGTLDDLEMMRLSHVCCLTIQSLRRLMARRSPFRLLHLYFCKHITNEDIDDLRRMIRVLNLDVDVFTDYLEFTAL